MKKSLLLLPLALLLFSACKKEDLKTLTSSNHNSLAAPSATILVDSIKRYKANFTDRVPDYYLTTFKYTGKLLTSSATEFMYQPGVDRTTSVYTNFYYNADEQLTRTSISLSRYGPPDAFDVTDSKVTYSGGHIATIEFFRRDGGSEKKFFLTYKNDLLVEIFQPEYGKISYEYDAKGNNIKEINQPYTDRAPSGAAITTEKTAFDDKVNFQKALPLWVYYKCHDIVGMSRKDLYVNMDWPRLQKSFTNTPGANNPLTLNTNGTPSAITYKYFDNGYPSQICDIESTWQYTYITVK